MSRMVQMESEMGVVGGGDMCHRPFSSVKQKPGSSAEQED